jgi:hypothetical protein
MLPPATDVSERRSSAPIEKLRLPSARRLKAAERASDRIVAMADELVRLLEASRRRSP